MPRNRRGGWPRVDDVVVRPLDTHGVRTRERTERQRNVLLVSHSPGGGRGRGGGRARVCAKARYSREAAARFSEGDSHGHAQSTSVLGEGGPGVLQGKGGPRDGQEGQGKCGCASSVLPGRRAVARNAGANLSRIRPPCMACGELRVQSKATHPRRDVTHRRNMKTCAQSTKDGRTTRTMSS